MGILDGDISMNPTAVGLLGAAAAMAPSLQYSRLPQSPVAGMLNALGGFGQGYTAAQQNQAKLGLLNQEIQQRNLANGMALWRMRAAAAAMNGQPIPPMDFGPASASGMSGASGAPTSTPHFSSAFAPSASPAVASGSSAMPTGTAGASSMPSAGIPNAAPPLARPAGGSPLSPDVMRQAFGADLFFPGAGKEIIAKQYPGPTDFMRAYQDYVNAPPQLKSLAEQKLITAAGDRYQLMRNGWAFDRVTNTWMHMPSLGEGVTGTIGPNGEMSAHVVPGAPEAAATMATANEGAKAQFDPLQGVTPNGTPYATNRLAIAPPNVQRTFGYQPPGSAVPLGPQGATPPVSPLTGFPVGTTVGQALAAQGNRGTPPGMPSAAPSTAPRALAATSGMTPVNPANPSAVPPGTIQTGLSPVVEESQKAHGKELEDYGQSLIDQASAAKNQQFIIDRMRAESGNGSGWTPNAFAEWQGAAEKLMNGLDPQHKIFGGTLSNYQAFVKNAMNLTTQATRSVSSRAAVQEMQMIREALPNPTMTPGALHNIFDQFSSVNDYAIAKENAANAWRTRPGGDGTLSGFETAWNKSVSPSAFLVHRMSPEDLQTMAANLGRTAQGRGVLKKIMGEVQYAQNNGLFQDGQ